MARCLSRSMRIAGLPSVMRCLQTVSLVVFVTGAPADAAGRVLAGRPSSNGLNVRARLPGGMRSQASGVPIVLTIGSTVARPLVMARRGGPVARSKETSARIRCREDVRAMVRLTLLLARGPQAETFPPKALKKERAIGGNGEDFPVDAQRRA